MKSGVLRISAILCLPIMTATAHAEDAVQKLETITVTAPSEDEAPLDYLKQEQESGALGTKSILDTPFSITVVDEQEIVERGAKSIGQIFFNDASVYTPTPSSQTDWWGAQIRGLSVRNYYIDDIPMLLYWGGDFPLESVESVTALKGLGGFMYGFGAPGGIISYKLKQPKATPETTISAGYRNSTLYSAQVDSSINVSDDLSIRGNVATESGTSYNASEVDRSLASLAIEKGFGDSVTWFTNVMYEDNSIDDEPFQFYFRGYDIEGSRGKLPKPTYDYDDFNVDNSFYDTETLIASTGLKWQLDEKWDLKYQLGFSRKEHQSGKSFAYLLNETGDYTGTIYNFAGQLDNLYNQLMLHGVVSTGSIEHEIVGGFGQSRTKEKWTDEFIFEDDFVGNLYQEQTFLAIREPDFSLGRVSTDISQLYAFLSDTVKFNENWQTVVGFRYSDYDSEALVDQGYQTKETTPTLALIYKPNAQTSLYGSYVEALEPGSRVSLEGDSIPYANGGDMLDATVSKQYEAGIKHESGKFDYTSAIFRIERASERDELRGESLYRTQDGLNIYDGAEFAGAYQFTTNLNIGLSLIYLDASIEDVSVDSAELAGNKPAYTPEWQVVANAEYKVAEVDGLKVFGNVRQYDESYTSDENTLIVPDYVVANAGFGYGFEAGDQAWSLYGNIYNLFNEKYWSGGGFAAGNMGEARNVSLSLSTTF